MKFLYAAIFVLIGICDTAYGVSVVVKENKVFVDDKPVDLTKLQVIKDSPLYTTYQIHSGESTITISKSKVGNVLSVKSVGPMTKEEKEKMEKMQKKIGEDVEKNIQEVQENINKFNKELNEKMELMNRDLQNAFDFSFAPFF
ncbi:uncharacterized protein [Halyomorpha halys]|uniref:uncharacterized protein n=1 Tax=Halyomorpha halys TaxID=286706 RepID=UPI0006D4F11D|nr:uncharacterized protein LOC106682271 isoform X1 [Halyomorpha halys]